MAIKIFILPSYGVVGGKCTGCLVHFWLSSFHVGMTDNTKNNFSAACTLQ